MNNFSNNSSIYFNTDPVIVHIEVTLRRDYFDDYDLIWSFGDTVKYNGTCYDDEVEKLVQDLYKKSVKQREQYPTAMTRKFWKLKLLQRSNRLIQIRGTRNSASFIFHSTKGYYYAKVLLSRTS